MKRAKLIKKYVVFPEKANLVSPRDDAANAMYMFRTNLALDGEPKSAVAVVSASDYIEVYINGENACEFAVRSYVYDRAYEAYDITPFLKNGKNTVAVYFFDSKTPINRGFVCDIAVDGERVACTWKYKKDASSTYVSHYVSFDSTEEVDMRMCDIGWYDADFNDSAWLIAKTNAYFLPDGATVYQVKQAPQAKSEIKPQKACIDGHFEMPHGEIATFDPSGAAVFFARFFADRDTEMTAAAVGAHSLYIDGEEIPRGEKIAVLAGEHTLAVFTRGGVCSIVYDAPRASFEEWRCVSCDDEKMPFTYPWNESRQKYKISYTNVYIIKNTGSDEIFQKSVLAERVGLPLYHELMLQKSIADVKRDLPISRGALAELCPDERKRDLVVDFGLERVGLLKIEFDAPPGAEITFDCYEFIGGDGPRTMGKKACGKIISRGGRQEFLSKRLRGFRYVSLCVPENVDIMLFDVSVIEMRYGVSDAGEFVSSDEKLDRIYKMSIDTAAVCMLDSYVDCPGYEQNIWVGDAGITAKVNMLSFGEREFDARYLGMIADSMSPGMRKYYRGSNPLYVNDTYLPCACFTTYPDGGIPIWSFTWVLQVTGHIKYFGVDDKTYALLDAVEECLRRCEAHMSPRGLFAPLGAWNLIEWANNDLSPYGEVSANNMMLCACYTNVSDTFKALGKAENADRYSKKAKALKESINKYCWNDERGAYVDTVRDEDGYLLYVDFCKFKNREIMPYETYRSAQRVSVQTATFALLFDVAEGERKIACEKLLLDDVERGNFRRGTPSNRTFGTPSENEASGGIVRIGTPFFLYYALAALFKIGKHDEALSLIKREWGAMLDDGINTCVETFKDERGEWGRSMAHAWSAAPAVYLKSEILGVKPADMGYKKFTVEPHPCGLTHAEGAVPTPYGNIYVEWNLDGGKMRVKVDAPNGCERI